MLFIVSNHGIVCTRYLSGAMKDSMNTMKKGFPALLPELDDGGRAIIYNDWSLIEVDNSGAPMKVEEVRHCFCWLWNKTIACDSHPVCFFSS